MHALWKKMQVKDQRRFLVVAAPEEVAPILADADPAWEIERREEIVPSGDAPYHVIVAFVMSESDVRDAAEIVSRHAAGDETLVWMCYPKKSSKKYSASINRDSGWKPIIDLGWEGVRQVAVDEDWSALRFRPRDSIKSYTRTSTIGAG